MHEQLSRLLAGELDPTAEAALRARIAADPSLAAAWERMSALPDLLAALPLEEPPPALMATLRAMVPGAMLAEDTFSERALEDALDAAFADLAARSPAATSVAAASFDPAPFAPDPREDTIDPEPLAPRAGAPVRLSAPRVSGAGRAASATSLADKRPAVTRSSRGHEAAPLARRRAWIAVGVAAALALGVGVGSSVGETAPPAPASLTLAAGESVVEGDVRVRAGDLDLRVDGRARISVTPVVDRVMADARGAELVVVAPRAPVAPERRARTEAAGERLVVAERTRAERAEAPEELERPYTVVGTPLRATVGAGSVVTIEVERGGAVVSAAGRDVRVAAGQSRSFDAAGRPTTAPVTLPSGPEIGAVEGPRPETPDVRVDHAVARHELPSGGISVLTRVLAALDTTGTEWPTDLGADWLPEQVEARVFDVEALVADVALVDLDCDEYPCLAVFTSSEAGRAWQSDVRALLVDQYPTDKAALDAIESLDGHTLVVAVGAIDVPSARPRLERRMDDALRDVRREPGP